MTGREDKNANNLFFLCSLIEYIGRKTKNHRNVIVNAIGKDGLQHIFDLADVYHSENMDKLLFELTEKYHIENGIFDNVGNAKYSIPTHWDIGKVYKRLIIGISKKEDKPFIDTLIQIYNSWLSRKIEDFNGSIYYESPEYLLQSYLKAKSCEKAPIRELSHVVNNHSKKDKKKRAAHKTGCPSQSTPSSKT